MKSTHALRLLSLAGLGCLVGAASHAQDSSYYYGGVGLGQSRARIDEQRITASLLAGGLTTTGMTRDESDTSYKVFGGYQVNRYFGLEGGYFKLGEFGFRSTTVPTGTLDGRIKLQGVNLDLVGTLPIGDRFSVFGRVGAQYARARDAFSATGAVRVANPNPSEKEVNPKVGFGLQYAFSPNFLVRGEAERYRINDAVGNHGDVNVFSVSLVFPFGRAPAPAPRAAAIPVAEVPPAPAPAPAPVAAAPAVIAAPAPAVMAPAPRRVSFSADSLFSFDQSVIRPEGKAALDTFVKDLQGTRFDMITVEGHTDRLGSTPYNQALSQRRAEAVKDHLVGAGRIDAARVAASAKGESAPVTRPEECRGNHPDRQLIACLQPDRRVTVEVTGTR
jgi:OOP family OmpA-OmpF porin